MMFDECRLPFIVRKDYTCASNCDNYSECTDEKFPHKCSYFNPTVDTLISEIKELKECIDDWNL